MDLVVATHNAGKLREFERLTYSWPVQLSGLECSDVHLPAETGTTFQENALLKAQHVALQLGHVALADDSGLVVPALNGAPGLYSARYAGPQAKSQDNVCKLLHELAAHTGTARAAYFICVLALAHPDGRTWCVEGRCEGVITSQPAGVAGFGYDPVFQPQGMIVTMAELPPVEKDRISHRGLALQKLRPIILDLAQANTP